LKSEKNILKKLSFNGLIKGANPLCNAALSEEIAAFKLMVSSGADPNERWSDFTNTPVLHVVLSHSLPLEKAKCLLFSGANVHNKDYLQQTAMHAVVNNIFNMEEGDLVYSSAQETLDAIDLLIFYKAAPSPKDIRGNTPLHLAAMSGYGPIILNKLIEIGNDINEKNFYGETALTLAAIYKRKKVIKYLLSQGAKKDLVSSICLDKQSAILKKIKKTKSINILDQEYNTELHYASERGLIDVVRIILDKGANINSFNRSHQTPLDIAIKNGRKTIYAYLEAKGGKAHSELSSNSTWNWRCGYWLPNKKGQIKISYSLAGVTKNICNEHNFNKESSKITNAGPVANKRVS
jgi:uncharacterized protein